jgi:uncharacterized protein involved in exopolysaccharide biosynthesis
MGVSRPVRLVRSALIEVPLVVGWLRPVILMPASSLLGLTPAQIEVILVHELAHIRRCDYLVNVLQKVVETLLFYHPAVWWISRSIREEREHCCDDLVVRICRDRMVYAQALFRLEQLRAVPAELALAATGGSLLRRVQRLLAASPDHWPVGPKEFGGLALVALGCVLFFSGLCFMLSTPIYRSTVRVCVECPWQSMRPLQSDRDRPYPTPYLLETEITGIESDLVLCEVVDALKLSQAWAGKAHEKLTDAATLATLRKHLRVRPVQNTALIEVAVFDNDAAESAAIANAVATSYVKYRERQLQQARGTDLRALQSRIEQQDAQVRRAESNVEYLRVSLNVPDYISAAGAPPPTMPPEDLRKLERLRIEGQAELIRQQTLLEQLKSIPRDRLAGMMPTITGTPDTLLTSYLEQLNLAEQRQIALQKDYGPRHMDVIKVTDQASDLKDKIRERIEGILLGMEANVAAMRQRQINLSNEVYAAMESDLAKAKQSRPYWDAKHQLDELQRFRQVLLMKMASEQTDASLPTPRAVEIVDHAGVPERQASPNRPRAGALLLAGMALMAIGMVLIRRSPISAATA